MIATIKKAYRYYFYRMYLFYLKRWNNNKTLAIFVTDIMMIVPVMANFWSLILVIIIFYNKNPMPDFKTHMDVILIAHVVTAILYLVFNRIVLSNNFSEIISEFKSDNENVDRMRGWLIAIYVIGSDTIFFSLLFSAEYW